MQQSILLQTKWIGKRPHNMRSKTSPNTGMSKRAGSGKPLFVIKTDRRTLPCILSPCFTVDDKGNIIWIGAHFQKTVSQCYKPISTWGFVMVRQILLGCNGINNNMTLDIFTGSARVVIVYENQS